MLSKNNNFGSLCRDYVYDSRICLYLDKDKLCKRNDGIKQRDTHLNNRHRVKVLPDYHIPQNAQRFCFIFILLRLCSQFLLICVSHSDIFFRVTSLALGQSYDCPSASEVTLKNTGKNNKYQATTNQQLIHNSWNVLLIPDNVLFGDVMNIFFKTCLCVNILKLGTIPTSVLFNPYQGLSSNNHVLIINTEDIK